MINVLYNIHNTAITIITDKIFTIIHTHDTTILMQCQYHFITHVSSNPTNTSRIGMRSNNWLCAQCNHIPEAFIS